MTTTTSTPIAATTSNGATAPAPVALRDKIFARDATVSEIYEVEAWGVTLEIRSMSVASKTKVTEKATKDDDDLDMGVMLPAILIATCHDPGSGEPVFTEADTERLSAQPAGVVEDIASVGLRLSGLSKGLVAASDVIEGKSDGS